MNDDEKKAARDYFAGEVAEIMLTLPQVLGVKRGRDFTLDVATRDGVHAKVHLENIFSETRDMSTEQRKLRIIVAYGSIGAPPVDAWSQVCGALVPVLRSATYSIGTWAQQPGAAPIRRPFLPFLDEIVVMDQPTTMMPILRAMVSLWNVDEQTVFAVADSRKGLFSAPSVRLYDDKDGPLWIVQCEDAYEASRLLVPGWLASFRGRVEGEPIAIMPQRSIVMIGGDRRPALIKRLLDKAAREFAVSTRGLSPALYSVDAEGRVIPYERAGHDELAVAVRVAHHELAYAEYEAQREVLNRIHASQKRDVYISRYIVVVNGDKTEAQSCAVWPKKIRTYLPRAERVILTPSEAPSECVDLPFSAIEARLNPLANSHPLLFEAGEFPSEHELAALATLART
ncbi:hypothetical protein LZC95_07875 [Pendulispora brunnea]|uniref:Uncharacterized protein n=1 Tax=Pendulispora brunnea TaxID=2905690 RepID=A0ABZ2KDP1_9BACT